MKKYGIIFLHFLVIILLFACTNPNRVNWVDEDKITIAWDPVPFDPNIHKGSEIRYLVYIDYIDPHKEVLVDKYVNGAWVDKQTPIAETSCTIKFKTPGEFYVGVQSVVCEVENESIKILKLSGIAWSDNKIYTHNNPFGVRSRK